MVGYPVETPAANPAAFAALAAAVGVPAIKPKRLIAGKTSPGRQLSDGTQQVVTYRIKVYAPLDRDVSNFELAFPNWYLAPAETAGANSITVKAAFEYGFAGQPTALIPLYFNGARSAVIEAGATRLCDPAGFQMTKGTFGYLRVAVSVASLGQFWPTGRALVGGASELSWNSDQVDVLGTAGGSNGFTYMYGPAAIIGFGENDNASVLIVGDSIAAGSVGEASGGDSQGNQGYVERALANNLPWANTARGSDQFATFLAAHSRRLAYGPQFATHAISEMGVNDIFIANRSLTVLQDMAISTWKRLAGERMKVFQTTITPRTTSTDSWATLANQTLFSVPQEAVRVAFNDWIRAGAPIVAGAAVAIGTGGAVLAGAAGHPLTGFFEVADIAESARNSGKWKVTGAANYATADGTHPTTAMYLLLAGGITLASLI